MTLPDIRQDVIARLGTYFPKQIAAMQSISGRVNDPPLQCPAI